MHHSSIASPTLRAFLAFFALLLGTLAATAQAPRIGDAVRVLNDVTGTLGANTVDVTRGDTVFRDQRITTKDKASAQFQFLDETYLAMSENASLVLDKFVYAGKAETGEVTINIAKGAFRFITGKQKSDSYRINLPSGVIGVRGTMFDLFVAASGAALVVLYDGAVEFCGQDGRCLDLTNRCEAAALGSNGQLSSARRLSQALLLGETVRDAVPFLADQTGMVAQARLPGTVVTDCLSSVASLLPAPAPKKKVRSAPQRAKPKAVHKRSRSNAGRKCPSGTVKRGSRCVRVAKSCPPGTMKVGKRCKRLKRVLRKCPRGTIRKGNRCARIARKCPRGTVRKGKRCVHVARTCPRGKVRRGGRCVTVKAKRCPRGTVRRGGRCVKVRARARRCPPGLIPVGAACVRLRLPIPGQGPSRARRRLN